jgi:uncharacterized protein (DUF927 family)
VNALDSDSVASSIAAARGAFRATYAPGVQSGQILRVADRFALIAAAGELAIGLGVLKWTPGSVTAAVGRLFAGWHKARGGDDPAEVRAAIDQIAAILEQHGESRFDPTERGPDTKPVTNRLGYRHGDGEDREWWVPPNIWAEVFCKGFDARTATRALVERGMVTPGERGRHNARLERIDGRATRVYALPARAWFGDEENPTDKT